MALEFTYALFKKAKLQQIKVVQRGVVKILYLDFVGSFGFKGVFYLRDVVCFSALLT